MHACKHLTLKHPSCTTKSYLVNHLLTILWETRVKDCPWLQAGALHEPYIPAKGDDSPFPTHTTHIHVCPTTVSAFQITQSFKARNPDAPTS